MTGKISFEEFKVKYSENGPVFDSFSQLKNTGFFVSIKILTNIENYINLSVLNDIFFDENDKTIMQWAANDFIKRDRNIVSFFAHNVENYVQHYILYRILHDEYVQNRLKVKDLIERLR